MWKAVGRSCLRSCRYIDNHTCALMARLRTQHTTCMHSAIYTTIFFLHMRDARYLCRRLQLHASVAVQRVRTCYSSCPMDAHGACRCSSLALVCTAATETRERRSRSRSRIKAKSTAPVMPVPPGRRRRDVCVTSVRFYSTTEYVSEYSC